MVFWGIIELQNEQFDHVIAPFSSQMAAFDHLDKIKAYRAKNPNALTYRWIVQRIYHPESIL